jgi:hypothetical protein
VVLSGISRELFEKGLSPPQNKCRVHKKEKQHSTKLSRLGSF